MSLTQHQIAVMAHVNGNSNGNGVDQPQTNGKSSHLKKASRKLSSPMMPAFMVSAPGKVIVFGEHAVVHGKVSAQMLSRMLTRRARIVTASR